MGYILIYVIVLAIVVIVTHLCTREVDYLGDIILYMLINIVASIAVTALSLMTVTAASYSVIDIVEVDNLPIIIQVEKSKFTGMFELEDKYTIIELNNKKSLEERKTNIRKEDNNNGKEVL